jgi:hypothetical protein
MEQPAFLETTTHALLNSLEYVLRHAAAGKG